MSRAGWIRIGVGLLAASIGLLPVLATLGILPTRPPQPGDAPAWLGWAIGLMFFLAGMSVIVRTIAGADDENGYLLATAPRPMRVFYNSIGLVIVVLLASVFSWIAFGPGERHFSVSGGSGGMAIATGASSSNDLIGRVAFGCGAVLMWLVIGGTILFMARRWFAQR